MTPQLKIIIEERLQILPQVLQNTLRNSAGLKTQLLSLEKGYNFSSEQMAIIENETALTLLAFTPYHDLPANIARELGMEESAVLPVVGRILSDIFTPEILKQLDIILSNQTDAKAPTTAINPAPTPTSAPIPVTSAPAIPSQPVAQSAPASWQHVQEVPEQKVHVTQQFTAIPPQTTSPQQTAPQTPPVIPQYQKPLTAVPEYRNADLYQKTPSQ